MKEIIESPFTDGNAYLERKANTLKFRKSEFEIIEHYYVCEDTKEEFTTSELDRINLNQVYNLYRDKFGILYPDQIRRIRERYDLSASKMSEILGLGANTYRLYEQGEVPSEGNSQLIKNADNPEVFLDSVNSKSKLLSEKDYKKLVKKIELKAEEDGYKRFSMSIESLFDRTRPNQNTGFRQPNLDRISHMIMFFAMKTDTWKVKLNKLLFFSDFLAFKNTGFGISGLDYRAIQLGPVPANYGKMYDEIGEGELLRREYEIDRKHDGSYFVPLLSFNNTLFESHEIEVMETVAEKFKSYTGYEISMESHNELGWINNIENKSIINYQNYGYYLKSI